MSNVSIVDLIKVARTDSQESRSFLANSLNDLCLSSGQELSMQEKGLVFDIIAKLINGIEHQVKKNLAENLSKRHDVPKDLIVTLANDEVFDIAEPVIIHSHILDDEDLIKLVVEKAVNYQIAITKREAISPSVSESLVNTENEAVISSLLTNYGANFKESTMSQMVELSKNMPRVREPLITRKDLDENLAKTMYAWIGDTLKKKLEANYDLEKITFEDEIDRAVQEALREDTYSTDIYIIDEELSPDDGSSSPRELLRALNAGDIFKFEEIFKKLTRLPAASVTRVLYDSGPEALAICCKAINVDLATFTEIYGQFSGRGNQESLMKSPQYQKTLNYFERIDSDGAVKVLDAWRDAPIDKW